MGIEGESGGIQDAFMMSVDENDGLRDKDEVNIRRMKNRERQRRYRARKRMREEAGLDDENLSFQTGQQKDQEEEEEEEEEEEDEEELECDNNVYVDDFVRRVYCHRDWKKEARVAHLIMDKTRDGSCLVHRKIRPRPRDWKAEARKVNT
ncbi:Uncharacterized protein Rs2_21785 [Raphanus sativus]|uniref:Uncharacterized protein C13E7.08c n=1 Tax=Raphanus sativus TaxID=3726 RepID=A0A6J0NX26_RAPSA|nr:uncharacterized protein C13E7.08c [Raphanus sativus]KAJ4894991.1 Uncharacterized protein Rs2_21785 [Raphanus sativus]